MAGRPSLRDEAVAAHVEASAAYVVALACHPDGLVANVEALTAEAESSAFVENYCHCCLVEWRR